MLFTLFSRQPKIYYWNRSVNFPKQAIRWFTSKLGYDVRSAASTRGISILGHAEVGIGPVRDR